MGLMGTQLEEHGFWDYTTPGAGGMENYALDDYMRLLDDMAEAGMNSLFITVKWGTTGYRSNLPYLDQLPGNPIIESDNDLLREVIEQAHKRKIKIWLGAVVSIYVVDDFGGEPYQTTNNWQGGLEGINIGDYDGEHPGFTERAVEMALEIVKEFPELDGFEVEMEGCSRERPHREAPYNAWARENDRRPFEELGHPMEGRPFDVPEWRDYTTSVRISVLSEIQSALRSEGFSGDLSTILETGCTDYTVGMEINAEMFHEKCPDWFGITYEYAKWRHRSEMMGLCINLPKSLGIKTMYLPRGVMTWAGEWPMTISLEESWRRDVEDIERHQPDGVWWFGSGAVGQGAHVSVDRLAVSGYSDGPAARRVLINATKQLGS